jgi:hypothetical protein
VSAIDYLSEDGSGKYWRWHVPDLVPSNRAVELVFVFESPHVDELKAGLPVVGAAGKSALRFLLPDQAGDLSLGRFVQQRHAAGDDRIAILNVSNVPMQAAAFLDIEAPRPGRRRVGPDRESAPIEGTLNVVHARSRGTGDLRGSR